MKKYELFVKQLKLKEFLTKTLIEGSPEYKDIKKQSSEINEKITKQNLYKTGLGYYELIRTDNSFYHCKRILKKDGVEDNKIREVICGAVVCSLMDFMLKPTNKNLIEMHYKALEEILGIEYVEYLESPISI
jgi:hypothetical protein